MTELARLIKRYREKKGLSQWDVAEHFGYTTPQYVSNCERAISPWPEEKAKELCELLEIPKAKYLWAFKKDAENEIKKKIFRYREVLR